jgi:hypothetical protein
MNAYEYAMRCCCCDENCEPPSSTVLILLNLFQQKLNEGKDGLNGKDGLFRVTVECDKKEIKRFMEIIRERGFDIGYDKGVFYFKVSRVVEQMAKSQIQQNGRLYHRS